MKARLLLVSIVLGLGLSLALVGLLGSSAAQALPAASYTVTSTAASGPGTLRQAILDANGNAGHDMIDFGISGTIVLTGALPAIEDDLTIGGPGADQLAVSGAGAYRVFQINSGVAVTISAVTVRDGSAVSGGGIWSAGDLVLDGMHILGNSATGSGGGVYVDSGSATLSGAQVVSNSASYGGGGVYVSSGSATLSGTQVVSNSSGFHGGGVHVSSGSATLSVDGGELLGNSAASGGGGVYVAFGSATLTGTQVVSNSAADDGGGVYVYDGSATLSGAQVVSNSAADDGGGVFVHLGSATLTGARVLDNSASGEGGGLYTSGSSGVITAANSCIVDNSDTAVFRSAGTLNASDNWWGAVNGPGGAGPGDGDTVSGGVSYTPFKVSAPAGCPGLITKTLVISITGSGEVELDPPGTTGSGSASFSSVYVVDTLVTMTATADFGWRFEGWGGDATGTAAFPLLMDSDKAVVATFGTDRVHLPLVRRQK